MKIIPIPREEKYLVIFQGEKIYINADVAVYDNEFKIVYLNNKGGRNIASFPMELTAIILNNSSK